MDESKEDRKARVASHRASVLRRMQEQARGRAAQKQSLFLCKLEFTNT